MDDNALQRLLNQPITPTTEALTRAPLRLNPRQDELTPAQKGLQDAIIAEVERECFTFGSFNLVLPESIASHAQAPSIAVTGLFQDGLDQLERQRDTRRLQSAHGKLSSEQLGDIARKGEFSVESGFPDNPHVWRVTRLFQEGQDVSMDKYKSRLAWSLDQLLVRFPNRWFHEDPLSVFNSLKRFRKGFWGLLDMLVGVPHYELKRLHSKLEETLKSMVLVDQARFQTGVNNLELLWKALPIMEDIAQEVDEAAIPIEVSDPSGGKSSSEPSPAMLHASETLFLSKLRNCAKLNSLSPKIGDELANLCLAALVVDAVVSTVKQGLDHDEKWEMGRLAEQYPILGRSDGWVERKMKAWKKKRVQSRGEQDIWVALDQITEWLSRAASSNRELQLVNLARAFLDEKRPAIKQDKEIRKLTTIYFRIWWSRYWTIQDKGNGVYYADKYRRKDVKQGFGYRWSGALWMAACILHNGLFFLIVVVIRVRVRAFIAYDEFYPWMKVNPNTGELEPDLEYRIPSMLSRTRRLWQSAMASRREFELKGDFGLLPKSSVRWLNCLWNYGVKVFIGTMLVWACQTLWTVLLVAISVLLVVTSPAWALAGAVLAYLIRIFIFDYDRALFPVLHHSIGNILALGFGQCAVSVVGAVLHVVAMLFGVIASTMVVGVRRMWDVLMFHALLKTRATLPVCDTFVARKISGPGRELSTKVYFQMDPSIILLSLFAHLETIELNYISEEMLKTLDEAPKRFQQMYNEIVAPIFGSASYVSKAVPQFGQEMWRKELAEKTSHRLEELKRFMVWDSEKASRIRLPEADLDEMLSTSAVLVEAFYSRRIFPRSTYANPEERVFRQEGVDVRDWMGLTKRLLCRLYSNDILLPLELVEDRLRLEISHIGLLSFGKMLIDGLPRDDLDKVEPVLPAIPENEHHPKSKPSVAHVLPRVNDISRVHFGYQVVNVEYPDILKTAIHVSFLDFSPNRPPHFIASSYTLMDVVLERTSPEKPAPDIRCGPWIRSMEFKPSEHTSPKLKLDEGGRATLFYGTTAVRGYWTGHQAGVRLVWQMEWSGQTVIFVRADMVSGSLEGMWKSRVGKEWGTINAVAIPLGNE